MNHPEPHDLTALAYALVSGPEREQLLEHIAACDACREAYDAAFEEQALVRDVMFEEVRSGEAEARALDKVLQALKSGKAVTEEKQAKMLNLFSPFAIGLQIAAALMIAAGVFYVAVIVPDQDVSQAPEETVGDAGGSTAKADIRVKGGNLVVAAPTDIEPDNAKWTRSNEVPLGVWCQTISETPVNFTLDGANLSFNTGACFQLQPAGDQVSVYLLRGDANLSNTDQVLRVLTNTNEFRAMPGSKFGLACDSSFNYSQRGKQVPALNEQPLVRAEVSKGEVFVVPYGEVWDQPVGGVLSAGKHVRIKSVESNNGGTFFVRRVRADGGEQSLQGLEDALKRYKEVDPKGYAEMRVLLDKCEAQLKQVELTLRVVVDNVVLEQKNGRVEISDEKRSIVLVIDNENYLVADVTINGQTETYKVANLDELAQKCPAIAELIGAVSIETPSAGKRKLSLKRAVYEQQELHEEKQQKEQRVK